MLGRCHTDDTEVKSVQRMGSHMLPAAKEEYGNLTKNGMEATCLSKMVCDGSFQQAGFTCNEAPMKSILVIMQAS